MTETSAAMPRRPNSPGLLRDYHRQLVSFLFDVAVISACVFLAKKSTFSVSVTSSLFAVAIGSFLWTFTDGTFSWFPYFAPQRPYDEGDLIEIDPIEPCISPCKRKTWRVVLCNSIRTDLRNISSGVYVSWPNDGLAKCRLIYWSRRTETKFQIVLLVPELTCNDRLKKFHGKIMHFLNENSCEWFPLDTVH